MNRNLITGLFLALALPASLIAQFGGPRGPGGGGQGGGPGVSTQPSPSDRPGPDMGRMPDYASTRSMDGNLAAIDADQRLIAVEDKSGKRYKVRLDDKTKYKADKKTELAGRKDLTLNDFHVGQPVRVTILASNNTVVELRLRHVKH